MTQENFPVFGEKSKFAIKVNLLQNAWSIEFWADSIAQERAFFPATPFVAEKFLSCMGTAWGRLFLEQTYPLRSEKTIFSPQHFVFVNKDSQETAPCVENFKQAHNVGSWIDENSEIYFMRQGSYIEITWERKTYVFSLLDIVNLFTSFGDFLASNLPAAYTESWNAREATATDNLLTYASGIADVSDTFREFIAQNISLSFHDLIKDHPYLAIARMSRQSTLHKNDIVAAIETIQTVSREKNDDKKQAPLPLWARTIPPLVTNFQKPYEQAYALAAHVRNSNQELETATGKIQIYPLLSNLGYEVYEKKLPDKIHALCVWSGDMGQFVLLNTSDNALGLSKNHLHRAAMAHELCHILLDKDRSRPLIDLALADQNDPSEKRARAFAAEFLLPRALAFKFITKREDKRETVDLLAWKYEVSVSIAANQLINGAQSLKKQLPPRISEYAKEIQGRSYYYDASETQLNSIIDELQALKTLQPGWYEGTGTVPSPDRLSWLAGNIEGSFCPRTLMIIPGIFPTPEGHVQMEWDLGSCQGILEFDLAQKTADWLMFNLDQPEKSDEVTIDLSNASGWSDLTNCITQLMEVAAND